MEPITSRTSTERIIRVGIFMVLVDVFTVLYLWDGYVGYAQQNRAELARVLGVDVDRIGPPVPEVTGSADLSKRWLQSRTPSFVHGDDKYFLGHGGWWRLNAANSGDATWTSGPRTESDIRWQRYIGWTLAVVGVFATLFFARVLGTRAMVADDGVKLTGKPFVRWEEITGLRADAHKRGVVELEYQSNGSPRTLRMDDYLYKDLGRISAAIAAKKSLHDPLAALQET